MVHSLSYAVQKKVILPLVLLGIIYVLMLNCSALGACSLGDIIYVCGGYDGVTSLNSVERYHPNTNAWCSVTPMNKSRSAGAVIACQGKKKYYFVLIRFMFFELFILAVVF